MPDRDEDPAVINQLSLDDTAQALRTGDVALMNAWFALPYKVETFDSERIMETCDEITKLFHDVRTFYQSNGVTQIHRRCVSASRRGTDEIVATFETRLLQHNTQVIDPFPSMSVTRWIDDRWLIVSTSYGIEHKNALSQILAGTRERQVQSAHKW